MPNRSVMIVLAYLWPLALVPLLVDKRDAEVQWHAKHGILLMVVELVLLLALLLALTIVTSVVSVATFGVGCLLGVLSGLITTFLWLVILAVHVVAIVKGLQGRRLVVPGISAYANRF